MREVKIKIPSLNAFDICFGYNITNPDLLVNHLILIAKYHIYSCKIGDRIPTLSSCKHLIGTIRCTEKTIAFNSNKIDDYIRKWKPIPTVLPRLLDPLRPLAAIALHVKCLQLYVI